MAFIGVGFVSRSGVEIVWVITGLVNLQRKSEILLN